MKIRLLLVLWLFYPDTFEKADSVFILLVDCGSDMMTCHCFLLFFMTCDCYLFIYSLAKPLLIYCDMVICSFCFRTCVWCFHTISPWLSLHCWQGVKCAFTRCTFIIWRCGHVVNHLLYVFVNISAKQGDVAGLTACVSRTQSPFQYVYCYR